MIARVARWRIPASILLLAVAAPVLPSSVRSPAPVGDGETAPFFKYPTGIAVDARGAVYVASAGDSSVVVFAPGALGPAAPIRRIGGSGSDLVSPQGIAIDSHGRLLVSVGSQQSRAKGSITVYAANAEGNAAPIRTIAGLHTLLQTPVGIALGRRGRIYVANGKSLGSNMGGFYGSLESDKAVVAFARDATGDVAPEATLPDTSVATRPLDIAVDTAGNLVTLDNSALTSWGNDGPRQRVFQAKAASRGGSIFDEAAISGFHPTRVAVGPDGTLYAAPRTTAVVPDTGPPQPSPVKFFSVRSEPKAVAVYTDAQSSDTTPQRIVGGPQAGLVGVRDIAVGRDGTLYVLTGDPDMSASPKRITVFPRRVKGNVVPARVIEGSHTRLTNPVSLAVGRDGRIYVLNDLGAMDPLTPAASIEVYAADAVGDASPIRTIEGLDTRMFLPTALAVADDGTLYVANAYTWNDDQGSVRTYSADADGAAPAQRTLVGSDTRLIAPSALALGRGDTVYVLGMSRLLFGKNRVTVFTPDADGEHAPIRVLEGDSVVLAQASGIAVDAKGQLFVAKGKDVSDLNAYGPDRGSVMVYRPGADGNTGPTRTIEGSYTRLNAPLGLARDRLGNIYVANRSGAGPGSITVYEPEAEEDVRPIRMIAGPATGLKWPVGVALDAHDTLYVVNAFTVTVYAPGASGNAAPVRTIGGS